ncbi:MAG: electron transfer flavoprotein subunit beta [Fastidiosipilaceae bacterium]|jgi:electron transfer flavoprotein beta subunit|nr:electron transfer flavoprotein subunit beta/FixA family protein [Clostridiaceae bacterium]
MKIIVCVKQVPDTSEVRIDPKTNTLIREGVPSIINPDDMNAIEAALAMKDANPGSEVTLVCMGPPQADVALREGLAMGCDKAILITDRVFGGSDTWATSNIIASALVEMEYDVIFCGRQAIDGDTAQVGPQIAECLDLPQVSYVADIKQNGDTLTVQRNLEDGYQIIEVKMPCLLTCIKELNEPRYPSMGGIMDAYQQEVEHWTNEKLQIDASLIGLKSSPTKVNRTFTPPAKEPGILVPDADVEEIAKVYKDLKSKHYL